MVIQLLDIVSLALQASLRALGVEYEMKHCIGYFACNLVRYFLYTKVLQAFFCTWETLQKAHLVGSFQTDSNQVTLSALLSHLENVLFLAPCVGLAFRSKLALAVAGCMEVFHLQHHA